MIVGQPIVLHVSEAEADVLQMALSMFRGPYGKERSELDPRDQPNHDFKTGLAIQMCEQIRSELTRLDEIAQESRTGMYRHAEFVNGYQLAGSR